MHSNKIPASIEMSSKQVLDTANLVDIAPPFTRIYITHVGTQTTNILTAAAKKITDAGYRAVPHFAARHLTAKKALKTRIKKMV
jgi:methylenetetrahydrofolate reductase (NADPH)